MIRNIIIAAIFLLNYGYVESGTNPLTITGGKDTKIKEYTFMASIYCAGIRCAGSIITKRLVITTAHCIKDYPADRITVHVGSSYRSRGKTQSVSKIYRNTEQNDTIILGFKQRLFSFKDPIGAIGLPRAEFRYKVGTTINALGFGEGGYGVHAQQLQVVKLWIVRSSKCNPGFGNLFDSQFCAENKNIKLSKEDEGGPVFYNNTLIGFVSLTEDEPNKGLSVIVQITKYLKFIHFIMKQYPNYP